MPNHPQLNKDKLDEAQLINYNNVKQAPITVLQVGEGNFLRGFFDWIVDESRKRGFDMGSIAVTQPRPGGRPHIEALRSQDGLYTMLLRGLENGVRIECKQMMAVFGQTIDPYAEWETFLKLAELPSLSLVVSNTTEAGLAYQPEPLVPESPVQSFPGKLTLLLYRRYRHFDGDPDKGLICLPCELLERNGDTLLACIERHCADWSLPASFLQWVRSHNRFLNSLVDRIVTGYPEAEEANRLFDEWGYEDRMLTTAEPYHLWAIEAEPELARRLPFAEAGLNVRLVDDLRPFQQQKVRILNGSHTWLAAVGLLSGLEHVRECVDHPVLGNLLRRTVEDEIVPALDRDASELAQYAAEVFERFRNPFIRHRLSDIALNSLSKFRTRLLPSLRYYWEAGRDIPHGLAVGLAALLRYCRVRRTERGFEGTAFAGETYIVRDDERLLALVAECWAKAEATGDDKETGSEKRIAGADSSVIAELLAIEAVWGHNLVVACPPLAEAVWIKFEELEKLCDE